MAMAKETIPTKHKADDDHSQTEAKRKKEEGPEGEFSVSITQEIQNTIEQHVEPEPKLHVGQEIPADDAIQEVEATEKEANLESSVKKKQPASATPLDIALLQEPQVKSLLESFFLDKLSEDHLTEVYNSFQRTSKGSRFPFLGGIVLRFLHTVAFYVDEPTMNEGQLSEKVRNRTGRNEIVEIARQNNLDQLIMLLDPRFTDKSSVRPIDLFVSLKAFVGAVSMSQDYLSSAKVSVAVLGPFTTDFTSWEKIRTRHDETKNRKDSKLTLGRVEDLGDYTKLERKIGYTFNDRLLLEDALSQARKKVTQQGLVCQRLELLGDALLDLLALEYWLKALPDGKSAELHRLHSATVNRGALGVAAIHIQLEQVVHFGGVDVVADVVKFKEELEAKELEVAESGKPGGLYWKDLKVRKLLANAYESLLGGVYVDSELCLDTARAFFNKTLGPILDEHVVGTSN
ncbi:hypothetical protein BGX27_009692 [Mortierella sp. AM989]|nr:hypothetical protein BGX27_009692 [Mortierella sp. AM989]